MILYLILIVIIVILIIKNQEKDKQLYSNSLEKYKQDFLKMYLDFNYTRLKKEYYRLRKTIKSQQEFWNEMHKNKYKQDSYIKVCGEYLACCECLINFEDTIDNPLDLTHIEDDNFQL